MDSQPVVTREYVSTLTEVPVETFDRDQLLASMALATTKSSDVDDFKTEHLPEPPLAMISSKIDDETQAMINLDKQYGINIQPQVVDTELKQYACDFSNLKSRKLAQRRAVVNVASQVTSSGTPSKAE